MKFLLGKKKEMTRIFEDDGTVVPVTVVTAGPCTVTLVRTLEKDGVNAVQIGFGVKKKLGKQQAGHLKNLPQHPTLQEFHIEKPEDFERGKTLDVTQFEKGDAVKVIGTSKGRGFAGVVRRHGFKGTRATHGNKDQLRMPGSIGATDPARVFKGTRMGGRMGGEQVTQPHLRIVGVNPEKHELLISGAVPGARNSLLTIVSE
ncbi:MAG: 50S ribosomal protein L3 [Patescibacteria group bacterium]|jgi:large subunit ribosomal protein L3